MGIQTMGTQGVDNGNGSGKQSQLQPLTRQNSLYSLTLDEVQNHLGDLGKPLTSMNLDELLKSVWTAELNHIVDSDDDDDDNTGPANQSGLQRQASLSLTGSLSKKTVDEVWRDIQQEQSRDHEKTVGDKQITLGEMTLEDFLVKAGVVADGSLEKRGGENDANVERSSAQQFPLQGQWMQYQQPQFHHPQQNMMGVYMPGQPISQHFPMAATAVMDCSFTENQMPLPSSLMGSLADTQGSSRKRVLPEDPVEKSVERRQKRMIKNRESAARSRARKQAYTTELEQKVSNLEEENARLKKRKELEKLFLQHAPPPEEPKYQLRRTSSSPF